jgi:hypothetical protein
MFDDLTTKQAAPAGATPVQPQPTPRPVVTQTQAQTTPVSTGEEKIYTMPMDYYLGDKTVAVTKGAVAGAPQQGMVVPAKSGGKKGKTILIGVVLGLVVVGSGVLLYVSTMQPVTPEKKVEPVAVVSEKGVTEPVVVDNQVVEPIELPITAPVDEKKFDPTLIRSTSLTLLGSVDTDKDGLTDAEELIIGTDPMLDDTDKDGYKDGQEVNNFYSPKESGSALLSSLATLKSYSNLTNGYRIIYPVIWTLTEPSVEQQVISSGAEEFVNILIETKRPDQTLENWYLEQAPNVRKVDLKYYTTASKLSVLESPDGFTVYLSQGDKVYILNYNIGLKDEANFPGIFGIIVNSFEFIQ